MIGKNIKQLRIENNLTMNELSKKCEISQSYISDLENGKVKRPSAAKLTKLAEALGVSITQILDSNYEKSKHELETALLNGTNDVSRLVSNFENSTKEESIETFHKLIDILDWKEIRNINDDDMYEVLMSQELYSYIKFLFFEKLNKKK